MAILDLSKLHMYRFHYEDIKKEYGDKAKLLFMDTDSLTYQIFTEDIYKDNAQHKELFDFSGYPTTHFLYSNTNKKVVGKFKDEKNSVPIKQFIGLAPKMYSIKMESDTCKEYNDYIAETNKSLSVKSQLEKMKLEMGRAKGVKKSYCKKHITHHNYAQCVTGHTDGKFYEPLSLKEMQGNEEYKKNIRQSATFQAFRSHAHTIGTYELNKFSLTNYDTKRYILSDGVTSLAYGHHMINELNH